MAQLEETTLANREWVAKERFQAGWQEFQLRRFDKALAHYKSAITALAVWYEPHYHVAVCCHELRRYSEAVVSYRDALRLNSSLASIWYHYAKCLKDCGELDGALPLYENALRLSPDNPEILYSLGLLRLLRGEWDSGWQGYELRFAGSDRVNKDGRPLTTLPAWRGKSVPPARGIVVYGEQGMGDAIMIWRYAALLRERFERVKFSVQATLVRLFAENAPEGVEVVPRIAEPIDESGFTFQVDLMSLPACFDTTPGTIPGGGAPYLTTNRKAVDAWAERFNRESRLKVGVVWQGGKLTHAPARDMDLADLAPLLARADVCWVSLQKDSLSAVHSSLVDWMTDTADMADTAALIANLDLVIAVDTAVAHLAGALGKPVWLLNRFESEWRWLRDKTTTPWYASMRIFSQTSPGDWASVVAQVASTLKELLMNTRENASARTPESKAFSMGVDQTPPSTAIYYHPEAYTTSGPKLMGRNAAGESFLRGFLMHSKASEFWVQVRKPEHARHFAQTVQAFNRPQPVKAVDKNSLSGLSQAGVIYYPGPGLGEYAWHRAGYGHGAWSLCGITHTTSSAGAMDAIAELLTTPVQTWDAVICTSTAVKDNVSRLVQAQSEFLVQRLGAQRMVLPQLPVIPLGIHTQDFRFTDAQKVAARAAVGADANTLVVLYTGRLSFHAKAHPLAMYQALEQAAATLPAGQQVVLVECGWHANDFIAKAYADAAQAACPSVRVVTLDGRKAENRQTAWACADVFCSLSDNIQETFGIVPIEAMAAGLPVVVSDWDGYKDTVRDGVDGFRVPTLMPGAGLGSDLALRHALEIDNYDMYCGHSCSFVAVDVGATANAFARLFASPELRREMGSAGQERARTVYDWAAIIPQYEALWLHLTEIRKAEAPKHKPLPHPWPARMDPFHAFASYPTALLAPQTVLGLVDTDVATASLRVAEYVKLAMVDFAKVVLPAEAEVQTILAAAAGGPKPAMQLIEAIPTQRQPFVFRTLAWLVKLGILKVCS